MAENTEEASGEHAAIEKGSKLLLDECEVVSNVELMHERLGNQDSKGFQLHIIGGYSDSNQSRIVRSLLQGVRDRLGTGLTRAMA